MPGPRGMTGHGRSRFIPSEAFGCRRLARNRATGTDHAMNVLLLETNWKGLKRVLEKHGCRVDTAATGAEADRKARAGTHSFIVLERELLNGDGLGLVRRWRQAGIDAHVLLVTAQASLQDKLDAFSVGVDDF